MCLFHKIKHSFILCLSTLYLSLVPERSVFFYRRSVKEYIELLWYTPESSVNLKKAIVCESVEFSGKHSFTLYPSLDPYRWADRQTERRINPGWAG
jgi:hypothetical protein